MNPNLTRNEFEYATYGRTSGTVFSTFKARFEEENYRKAEAMAFLDESEPLEKIRALIARGKLDEANALVPSTNGDPEVELEKARIAAMSGDWSKTIEHATRGLQMHPLSATYVTLLQVRATAALETGEFRIANSDIELIRSAGTIFPSIPAKTYADVLALRLIARNSGTAAAWPQLEEYWKQALTGQGLNRDRILSLLRAELDLCRLELKPVFGLAKACEATAEILGDELYAALARLDEIYSEVRETPRLLRKHQQDIEKFSRVRALVTEAETTTGKLLKLYRDSTPAQPAPEFERKCQEQITHLLLLKHHALIRLEPFKVDLLSENSQQLAFLRAIGNSERSKAAVFEDLFNGRKFAPEIHDGYLRNLISRTRKQLDLQVISSKGNLRINGLLMI